MLEADPPLDGEPQTTTYAIEVQDLKRKFGSALAVDGLNLKVPEGCFLGFLGANGAGKSTTIKMLTGLLRPSSGTAFILGHDIGQGSIEAKRLIGVVPEDLAIHDRLTGSEYLTFVGRMYGLDRESIKQRRTELLAWMHLDADPSKLIVDYSHGMQKKIALAAALIHDPRILFLDEPFEGVDVIASSQIRELLLTLLKRGVTIFLTSHVLEIVEKLCTHVAVIHQGKLIANGPLEELQKGIDDESGKRRSLEETFLDLVGADFGEAPTLSWLS
jgi:ABC-2 type transport system ATP-binding protein